MLVDTIISHQPGYPDHERRCARRDAREELPEPTTHAPAADLAAVEAQFAATSNGPVCPVPPHQFPDLYAPVDATDDADEAPSDI